MSDEERRPRRRASLFTARHLVTTARNLQANGRELRESQVEQLVDALEDLCLMIERRRRRSWHIRWQRTMYAAGWYRRSGSSPGQQ